MQAQVCAISYISKVKHAFMAVRGVFGEIFLKKKIGGNWCNFAQSEDIRLSQMQRKTYAITSHLLKLYKIYCP